MGKKISKNLYDYSCKSLIYMILQIALLVFIFSFNSLSAGEYDNTPFELYKTTNTEFINSVNYVNVDENLPLEVLQGNIVRRGHVYGNNFKSRKFTEALIQSYFSLILPSVPDSVSMMDYYPLIQYSDILKKSLPVRAGPCC